MATNEQLRPGRPGISKELVYQVLKIRADGGSAQLAKDQTGLSLTKIYEIFRSTKEMAPAQNSTGPTTPTTETNL